MAGKKSPNKFKIIELNSYKVQVPIESNIHLSNFEHDEIVIAWVDRNEKNLLKTKTSFEADDSETFRKRLTEVIRKFAALSDGVALLYDKGMRLGDFLILRGERQEYPDGKKLTLFRGWGKEEVMVYEETLKEKVVPLYERLKNDDSRFRRCLTWFNRGLSEYDNVDKFLNFWISLEAITPLHSKRDKEAITEAPVDRTIQELQDLRDDNLRSQIIQCMKNTMKYKSIPEAMTDEIKRIISETQVASILSSLNDGQLEKVLRGLSHDRAQIAHGEQREIQDLEKKTDFLHDLIYAILRQHFYSGHSARAD